MTPGLHESEHWSVWAGVGWSHGGLHVRINHAAPETQLTLEQHRFKLYHIFAYTKIVFSKCIVQRGSQQVLTLQMWNCLPGGLTAKLHLDFHCLKLRAMPKALPCFRGQLYLDSQVHPRFSEAGTGVGEGGEAGTFLKRSFTVESGGTLTEQVIM